MAGRSSTTFQKRQKELARQDKQKEKAAKRVERKVESDKAGPRNLDDDIDYSLQYVPDAELLEKFDAEVVEEKQPE
ncbi:MAG: hypothetical protein M3Z09_18535 [Acidobacteriota bacterium]|nr:hypothetical protein [Acidobacteriota bacterium]